MKTFLIIISIIGAIVYGMLQINEYYDNKGACSWSLLHGGYYYHKERLDNVLNGFIKNIIVHDKNARRELMKQQGLSELDIDKTIKALEPQYEKERKKIVKYCDVDTKIFQKQIMKYNKFTKAKEKYEQVSVYANPSKYCQVSNMNDYEDKGYGYFDVTYKFDEKTFKFFNEPNYVFYNRKDDTLHLKYIKGIYVHDISYPCKTRYIYGGEAGGIYGSIEKKVLDNFDKTKYIIFDERNRRIWKQKQ